MVVSYWKKIIDVFSGMAIAQAIPLLGSLLIARIYAPDNYGAFATWLGISQLVTVSITCRLDAAFGLEADGRTRTELVAVTVALVLLTGSILCVLVAILALTAGVLFGSIPVALLWLLVPQSMGMALSLVWQSWAANNGELKKLSRIRITQELLITPMQIMAGLFYPDVISLAAAQILAIWINVLICLRMMPLRTVLAEIGANGLLRLIVFYGKKYSRFPLLAWPADLTNTAVMQLPVMLISSRFGTEIAGYYALANRIMGAPVGLLGGAIRDVFKRAANEELRTLGHCRPIYRRTFFMLLGLSLAMVAVVVPFAEALFSWGFGAQWAVAGTMTVWLLPRYALGFMASPLSYIFYLVQKQHIDLFWQIGLLALTLPTLLIFASYQSTLLWYSGAYALMYVVYLALSWRFCQEN